MRKLTDKAVEELKITCQEEAKIINEEHDALLADCAVSQASARSARDRALVIGGKLAKVKDAVGHGRYLAWIEANCSFSHDTANNYTKFAEASKNEHDRNLSDDLSLRQAMIALDIIPNRPRDGGGTYRGSHIPSVYDPLNSLTKFLGAVEKSGTPQEWETDLEERRAVQQQYAPKLEELILRLFGVKVQLANAA